MPDALDLATPCDGWDVRTLLRHLVGVHRRVAHVGAGGHFAEVSGLPEVADGDLLAELGAARAEVERVWGLTGTDGADGDVLDRELSLPWGTMPGRFAGFGYVQEFTVHAWDLAAATDRTADLDDALAEAVEEPARRMVPAETRGGPVPFGPPVPAGRTGRADAGPYARLVAWLGRDPSLVPGRPAPRA